MNLLLLLSALLSALSGTAAGVRATQVSVAVSLTAESSASVGQAAPSFSARPAFAPPTRRSIAFIDGPAWRLAPAAPLYLSRRRE